MRPKLQVLCIIAMLLFSSGCSGITPTINGLPGVAVWELEDLSADERLAFAGELLTAQIIESLGRVGKYAVVERSRLVRILEEQHLSAASLSDHQTQLRLGELTGARYMVFGGYQRFGEKVRVDMRLVDVETGTIVKAVMKIAASSDLESILAAAKLAAMEL